LEGSDHSLLEIKLWYSPGWWGVGGEKHNQKVRIGGAGVAAKIRTGSQLQVPSLTTQPS